MIEAGRRVWFSKKELSSSNIVASKFSHATLFCITSSRLVIPGIFHDFIGKKTPAESFKYKTAAVTFQRTKLFVSRLIAFFSAFLISSSFVISVSGNFSSHPCNIIPEAGSPYSKTSGNNRPDVVVTVSSPPARQMVFLVLLVYIFMAVITSIAQLRSL